MQVVVDKGWAFRALAMLTLATGTAFTNSGVIRVNPNDMFNEVTLVHEYGHFAQESIGAYYLWPSVHDGCFIGSPSAPGNTREFAWFEGFPAFFSKAVRMVSAARYRTTESPQTLSSFTLVPCAAIGLSGPGGTITMPLIGAVPARGRTPQGLAADITARLRNGFIREPSVAVEIESYRPFFILGEVQAPGQYPYVPNMTAESAVAIAGGYSPRARKDRVTITHTDASGTSRTMARIAASAADAVALVRDRPAPDVMVTFWLTLSSAR